MQGQHRSVTCTSYCDKGFKGLLVSKLCTSFYDEGLKLFLVPKPMGRTGPLERRLEKARTWSGRKEQRRGRAAAAGQASASQRAVPWAPCAPLRPAADP